MWPFLPLYRYRTLNVLVRICNYLSLTIIPITSKVSRKSNEMDNLLIFQFWHCICTNVLSLLEGVGSGIEYYYAIMYIYIDQCQCDTYILVPRVVIRFPTMSRDPSPWGGWQLPPGLKEEVLTSAPLALNSLKKESPE